MNVCDNCGGLIGEAGKMISGRVCQCRYIPTSATNSTRDASIPLTTFGCGHTNHGSCSQCLGHVTNERNDLLIKNKVLQVSLAEQGEDLKEEIKKLEISNGVYGTPTCITIVLTLSRIDELIQNNELLHEENEKLKEAIKDLKASIEIYEKSLKTK